MQQTAEKLQSALLPAMEQLIPVVLGLVGGFSSLMDSDFMRTVLHGGDQKKKKEQDAAWKAQVGADNFRSKIRGFVDTSTVQTNNKFGLGMANQGRSILTDIGAEETAPIFAGGKEQLAETDKEMGAAEAKLKADRKNFEPGTTDDQIASLAKMGDKPALEFGQDKQNLERLQQSHTTLATALDNLRTALDSGQITVKLAPGSPTPGGGGGGTTPPDSPVPQ
jgi:hypothetical protein